MGRSIDLTIQRNLLMLKAENQFLKAFREKQNQPMAYIRLGKPLGERLK